MGYRKKAAELVDSQKAVRPVMRARDAYKLLYQGVFGVGHIMGPCAWDYLQREASELDAAEQPNEPLMEPISVDGSIVRLNLRPFIRGGHQLSQLMEALRLSNIQGKPSDLLALWKAFTELVWSGRLDFDHSEVEEINKILNRTSPQPMHHTNEYREAYHPAYRVVSRREAFKILGLNEATLL